MQEPSTQTRWLAELDARIAQGAFPRFPCRSVVVDFLGRAARDAHPPVQAFLLIHQEDTVFLAFASRARGAGPHKLDSGCVHKAAADSS